MPHDQNGRELKPGDRVTVEFEVANVYPGAEQCNITLTRAVPGEQGLHIACQAKQCVSVMPDVGQAPPVAPRAGKAERMRSMSPDNF